MNRGNVSIYTTHVISTVITNHTFEKLLKNIFEYTSKIFAILHGNPISSLFEIKDSFMFHKSLFMSIRLLDRKQCLESFLINMVQIE